MRPRVRETESMACYHRTTRARAGVCENHDGAGHEKQDIEDEPDDEFTPGCKEFKIRRDRGDK